MEPIISFLNAINHAMDYMVAVLFILLLIFIVVSYTIGRVRSYVKHGDSPTKGLFLGTIQLVVMALVGYIILWFPAIMENAVLARLKWSIPASVFRWILLFPTIPLLISSSTRKYSGRRGLYSSLVILTISLFGWMFEHWIGIILISLPIYGILLILIYYLAQVILPSSNPEDKKERQNKFYALFAYMIGMQMPVWIAKESAGREFDTRIPGDNTTSGIKPGVVWTHSHQVAGITAGIEFSQVEGPGILFTKTYERPAALLDLRTQIRTVEFDAFTKDGIAIKPVIFSAFVIDFEDWPKKTWRQPELTQMAENISQNPFLEKGIKIDKKIGSYWYSTARVKSILSTAGINTSTKDGEAGPVVNWDDWAVKQIENAARQILSQRTVDELWRPVDNKAGASALDEIALQIRKIVEPNLHRIGINLLGCRVVNFNLPEDSPIRKQQIDSWKTLWDQRITAALSDAAAIREEEIEKAHAYAKSEILNAIADSIEKARALHPDLPRHVIALYYIHAVEQVAQKQPASSQETKERLDTIKSYLLYNQ